MRIFSSVSTVNWFKTTRIGTSSVVSIYELNLSILWYRKKRTYNNNPCQQWFCLGQNTLKYIIYENRIICTKQNRKIKKISCYSTYLTHKQPENIYSCVCTIWDCIDYNPFDAVHIWLPLIIYVYLWWLLFIHIDCVSRTYPFILHPVWFLN